MTEFEGKRVFVTGSGAGIGKAISKMFIERGARVVVSDIDEGAAAKAAEEIGAAGIANCDVTDEGQVQAAVAQAVEVLGGLDIVVNNAGVTKYLDIMDVQEEDWDRIHRVNAKGVFFCMQRAAKELIAQGQGGRIINIASIAGHLIHPFAGSAYSISKTALSGLTREMANEFAAIGVRVNAVSPGEIKTDMIQPEYEMLIPRIPLNRMGTPDDVARAIYYLSSEESSYVTGTEIWVTGGQHMF